MHCSHSDFSLCIIIIICRSIQFPYTCIILVVGWNQKQNFCINFKLTVHEKKMKMCFHSPGLKINRFLLYGLYFMKRLRNVFLRNSKNKNSARGETHIMCVCICVLKIFSSLERSAGLMISNLILMTGHCNKD